MNKIIDTFLLKTTIPITRTYPEGARRAVPNPGMPYSQLATLAARSPHCFSVGNARARYSHTAPRRVVSRAFIIRALPPRGCRKHGRPCENPAGSGALPPMHDFRWSRTLHHATGYSYFAREGSSRTQGNERMRYARVSTRIRDET